MAAAAAGSGRSQDRPTFRGGVDLVDVDVVATGRNGEPVRDLTAADFEILEDGRAQEIRTFALVDIPVAGRGSDNARPDVEPDVTTNAEREGRLYVMLLDTPSTAYVQPAESYDYTARAKQVALEFVTNAVQPGDQVAVVHVQGTFTDSQSFTTSRRLINASIERYGRGRSGTDSLIVGNDNGGPRERQSRNLETYRVMEDLAARLGTIRGRRKAIIWIGGQIDIEASPTLRFAYRDAMRAAARNDVAIYPIDPVGGSPETGAAEVNRVADLRAVAKETGGIPIVNTSNFSDGFAAIVQDLSVYYLLGYSPDRNHREGSFHSIEVRVKRPGVAVRARRGYSTPPRTGPAPRSRGKLPGGVSVAAVEALARPLPTRGLRVDVFTSAFKSDRRERPVVIGANVDGQSLHLDRGASLALSYKIFDVEGHQVAGRYKVFDLNLQPATRAIVAEDGLRFFDRVPLRPGRYELRLVAEQADVALGSVIAPVDVPEFKEPLAMSGVVLATTTPRTTTGVLSADVPLRSAMAAEPIVVRRFTTRDTLVAFAEVYSDRPDDWPAVVGTLVTNVGTEVAHAVAQAVGAPPGGSPNTRGYRVAIELRAVPPGQYVLALDARSPRTEQSVRREIPLSVE